MSQTAKKEEEKEQLYAFLPGTSEEGHFVISDFQHPRKARRQQGWGREPGLLSVAPVMQSGFSGEVGDLGMQLVLLSSLPEKRLQRKGALG